MVILLHQRRQSFVSARANAPEGLLQEAFGAPSGVAEYECPAGHLASDGARSAAYSSVCMLQMDAGEGWQRWSQHGTARHGTAHSPATAWQWHRTARHGTAVWQILFCSISAAYGIVKGTPPCCAVRCRAVPCGGGPSTQRHPRPSRMQLKIEPQKYLLPFLQCRAGGKVWLRFLAPICPFQTCTHPWVSSLGGA